MRTEVVLKDVSARKNGGKTWVVREYSLTRPKVKLQNKLLWIRGSCWEKGWSLNWLTKLGPTKKTPLASFPSCLLKNAWIILCISLCHVTPPRGSKARHHWVVGGTNAKLPHYKGPTLIYSMENKMSLIHHAMERWGCSYINKDDKSLSERIRGHLMLKPKSKLMQMEWE